LTRAHPRGGSPVGWRSETLALGDEQSLHLVQAGEGPDLVLIHGALTTHQDWLSGPAEALLPGRRITIVDRPGHGLSRRPRFFGTPRDQARQIAEGLAAAGVKRASLVGHSFGALVALALGEQRPELVAGLVLVSPLIFPEPRPLEQAMFVPRSVPLLGPLLSRIARGSGMDRAMLEFAQREMFKPGEIPDSWKKDFPFEQVLDPDVLVVEGEDAATILPLAPAGLVDLSQIRVPVHVVIGESDRVVAHDRQGRRLVRLLHNARLTGIEGAGHMLHHSHILRLVEILRQEAALTA
jgi:pimeloyl-ACP methyl ester carboxylesterase